MDTQEEVFEFLKLNHIPYRSIAHEPVHTMEDCRDLFPDAAHCKNLFLCNRQKTAFYLLLLEGEKPFVTKDISHQLGVSRLSFGDEESLKTLLHTFAGAVSPMGLLFPSAKEVTLLCDQDLVQASRIAFHPLVNTASLEMTTDDFLNRFLPACGHTVTFVQIPPNA